MDDVAIGRRVAAARKRAGIDQRKKLTDTAELPRVGPATLGKIERGERHLFPHEAERLAQVLGVDRAFFYEETANGEDRLAQFAEQLDELRLKVETNSVLLAQILQRLEITPATEVAEVHRVLQEGILAARRLAERAERGREGPPSQGHQGQAHQ